MRVVVTGSTSAVGRRVCARLAATGHDVLGLDRRSSVPPAPGVEIRVVDLAVADLRNLLAEADTVVHLASEIGRGRVGKECRSRWSPYH